MRLEPCYIDGSAGRLFALLVAPDSRPSEGIVYCPPFAEEANRARRTAVLCARRLTDFGVATLIVDPYGCGDSEGNFGEARWEIWVDDIARGVNYLRNEGVERTSLVGLRLGACLAGDYAASADSAVHRLVLWQPVVKGASFLTQFLRLRSAHEMIASGSGVSTSELRETLASGTPVEVAGYELAPELFRAVESLDLEAMGAPPVSSISWIEIGMQGRDGVSRPSAAVIDRWSDSGANVEVSPVVGERIWDTQEITIGNSLIDATVERFRHAG